MVEATEINVAESPEANEGNHLKRGFDTSEQLKCMEAITIRLVCVAIYMTRPLARKSNGEAGQIFTVSQADLDMLCGPLKEDAQSIRLYLEAALRLTQPKRINQDPIHRFVKHDNLSFRLIKELEDGKYFQLDRIAMESIITDHSLTGSLFDWIVEVRIAHVPAFDEWKSGVTASTSAEFKLEVPEIFATWRLLVDLHTSIIKTMKEGLLSQNLSDALLKKMERLIRDATPFNHICELLDEPTINLCYPSDSKIEDAETSSQLPSDFEDKNPSNITKTQPQASTNAKLTLFITIISLIATVPAYFAFYRAGLEDLSLGNRWLDSNFFSQVASSILQLINVYILCSQSSSPHSLIRAAKWGVFVLVGTSTMSSLLAIVLYGTVSPRWSAVVAFTGAVAQTLSILQQMFLVKEK